MDFDSKNASKMMDALGRVLDEADFEAESVPARLLSYVVIETVEGRASGIKAMTIAQDVFARGASFDPSKDSVVRVEMKRLRERLKHHYETTGKEDAFRIEIPKGTYVPKLVSTVPTGDSRQGRVSFRRITLGSVAILLLGLSFLIWDRTFRTSDPGEGEPKLAVLATDPAASFVEAVAVQTLSHFSNLSLVDGKIGSAGSRSATYRLELSNSDAFAGAQLVHVASGTVLAAQNFDAYEIGNLEAETALSPFRIWLGSMLSKNGIMEADYLRRGEAQGDFVCSGLTEKYFSEQNDANHAAARDCIHYRLRNGHASARLFSDLALLYREEHSDQRNLLDGDPLARASRAARNAIAEDRFDSQAHYALMTVLFASGAVEEAIVAGDRSIELNPFDGEAIGGYAARLNYVGQHAKARSLFRVSEQFIPGGVTWRDYGYFLAYLGEGDLDRAARAGISLIGLTNNSLYVVALAISYAHLGEMEKPMTTMS